MQNRNIFRWLAAAVIALLVAYLRVTGYLPDSGPEAANEAQTVAESESAVALEAQTTAENEQEAAENQTSTENTQAQISSLTRDEFCRTTYEVFVYSFCDSDGAGMDENRRAPMHWSDDPQAAGMCAGPAGMDEIRMEHGSLEKQAGDPNSIFNYVREAVRIRENLPAIARKDPVIHFESEEHVWRPL